MRRAAIFSLILLVLCLGAGAAFSDHGDKDRKRERHQGGRGLGEYQVPTVNNPLYKEQCGACHMAYQPALLPAASWGRILALLPEHFGDQVDLSPQDRAALNAYLTTNAAESCGCKISRKILKSLGGGVPLRISQLPYILHKHEDDDIPAGAFERKSVGSRGNCRACHPTAEQGQYDDDLVHIPR
ncbi:MAG: diheme cytochrome c [Desulfarculaceae bacterium]|nr:diheme cytochrome c [Desulfarculaceae bacterium]MCF8048221.1 diheme cytochrome c [Desulfarculaceae bacterium]MCF8097850.1 diheme cytochrome c [Desulfarculaceae bacterium]MCF8122808.1 diheme cytochrome c [Desulfarculaceae bacterium]